MPRSLLLAVVLAGCSARTGIPEPVVQVCAKGSIGQPIDLLATSTCALVDGRCPDACFAESVRITSCDYTDCETSRLFACHARAGLVFGHTCAVRLDTLDVYEWIVERPMPEGFRACLPGEKPPPHITQDVWAECTIG